MGKLDTLQSKKDSGQIVLEKGQEREFFRLIKMGIYKELHKKGIITEMELKSAFQHLN